MSRVQQYVCVSDDTLLNVKKTNVLTAECHFRNNRVFQTQKHVYFFKHTFRS